MANVSDAIAQDDPFDLRRFVSAQESAYNRALSELRNGQKRTHWMRFIFPQIEGLRFSETSRYYAIKSMEEARHYLSHPILGARLLECAQAILAIEGRSASQIFGYPDDLKLKSSMTLFESAAGTASVFARVLDKYSTGVRDAKTLALLRKLQER